MSKHTSGPWKIKKRASYGWVLENGSRHMIVDPFGGSIETDYADVHLIAAAPEMLSMLKEYAARYRCYSEYNKAKKIIDKAEGK